MTIALVYSEDQPTRLHAIAWLLGVFERCIGGELRTPCCDCPALDLKGDAMPSRTQKPSGPREMTLDSCARETRQASESGSVERSRERERRPQQSQSTAPELSYSTNWANVALGIQGSLRISSMCSALGLPGQLQLAKHQVHPELIRLT